MSGELPTIKNRDQKKRPQKSEEDIVATVEKEVAIVLVSIDFPMAKESVGYTRRRHDLKLNGNQAAVLRKLALGLGESGARLADGKFVESGNDALRWMLENLGQR